jgi:hypothetical protein
VIDRISHSVVAMSYWFVQILLMQCVDESESGQALLGAVLAIEALVVFAPVLADEYLLND